MIIPSKQLLLLTPSDHKQMLLFDPKTGCVLQTYRSQNQIASIAAYYEQGQQFIVPNLNNSFVFVWDADTQQPRKFTVGDGEKISYVRVGDGNVGYVGSETGMLYIYQLPTGILIKKVQLHPQHSKSSQIKTIIPQHPLGYLLTSTKNQLKQFTLHSILSSTNQKPLPLHTIQSVLQIKSIQVVRDIICVITERTIQFYYASNLMPFTLGKDLPQIQGITCSCASSGSVFVGDGDGRVREIVVEGGEMGLRYEERKGRLLVESKKGIQIQCKQPITSLKYIQALSYLILTTSKGNIQIHNTLTQTHKNTLQLSKCPLEILLALPRPSKQIKIPQSHKIRSFHKQQLNKLDQPILYNSGDNHQLIGLYQLRDDNYSNPEGKNQAVLEKMFGLLADQSQSVREEVEAVRKDNLGLVEANLRYFGILEAIGDGNEENN